MRAKSAQQQLIVGIVIVAITIAIIFRTSINSNNDNNNNLRVRNLRGRMHRRARRPVRVEPQLAVRAASCGLTMLAPVHIIVDYRRPVRVDRSWPSARHAARSAMPGPHRRPSPAERFFSISRSTPTANAEGPRRSEGT